MVQSIPWPCCCALQDASVAEDDVDLVNSVIQQMNRIHEENGRRLKEHTSAMQSSRMMAEHHVGRVRELEQKAQAQAAEAKIEQQKQADDVFRCTKRLEVSEKEVKSVSKRAGELSKENQELSKKLAASELAREELSGEVKVREAEVKGLRKASEDLKVSIAQWLHQMPIPARADDAG